MIQISHLTKTFPTNKGWFKALDNVSLHIKKGEIFGIIGPSGAGKSTLVQCINFLERPDSGKIVFDGQELQTLKESQLRKHRRKIGMIFQSFNLLERRTVFENVELPLEIVHVSASTRKKRVSELLSLVGLEHLRDRYPHQLSGGQKQRVGIARALAVKPDLLLSDEATSALDPETTSSILQLLKDIQRKTGVTVIMITHQMEVVKAICDRVAVISGGKIIEEADTSSIFANPQQEITKNMIASSMNSELSDDILELIQQRPAFNQDGSIQRKLWKLELNGTLNFEHILHVCTEKFALSYRIEQAKIENIKGVPIGTVFVSFDGTSSNLTHAKSYFAEQSIALKELA